MLRSDLFDYSDAYIVIKGRIIVEVDDDDKTRSKKLNFKDNASFWSYISKINNTFKDNAEDLDIFIPMYTLLEYSDNYSVTSESLWNFYRDKINDSAFENDGGGNKTKNNKTITS